MLRWIASRLLAAVVTMMVASLVIYASLKLIPGDPVSAITAGGRLTPEQKEALSEKLGLNQDFLTGFLQWFGGIARLDFGNSLVYGTSVNDLVGARLPTTAVLVLYAAALAAVIGLGIAIFSALRPGAVDRTGLVLTSLSIATPSFVIALILLAVFAVQLGWFPATGAGEGFFDVLYHLTLPALSLAIVSFGILARVARAALREQLGSEHVEVARSRGVSARDRLWRHVFRNSLGPIATLFALLFASLFIGTAIVETAFGIDGVGSLLVVSIGRRDFPVVQAISLFSVGLFVVLSTTADLLMPVIDPRVRLTEASR